MYLHAEAQYWTLLVHRHTVSVWVQKLGLLLAVRTFFRDTPASYVGIHAGECCHTMLSGCLAIENQPRNIVWRIGVHVVDGGNLSVCTTSILRAVGNERT